MTAPPDYAEAILGWRIWTLVPQGHDWRLRSVVVSDVWRPRAELVATCNQDRNPHRVAHHSPHLQCTCGIYAAADPDWVSEHVGLGVLLASVRSGRAVGHCGRVRAWVARPACLPQPPVCARLQPALAT